MNAPMSNQHGFNVCAVDVAVKLTYADGSSSTVSAREDSGSWPGGWGNPEIAVRNCASRAGQLAERFVVARRGWSESFLSSVPFLGRREGRGPR